MQPQITAAPISSSKVAATTALRPATICSSCKQPRQLQQRRWQRPSRAGGHHHSHSRPSNHSHHHSNLISNSNRLTGSHIQLHLSCHHIRAISSNNTRATSPRLRPTISPHLSSSSSRRLSRLPCRQHPPKMHPSAPIQADSPLTMAHRSTNLQAPPQPLQPLDLLQKLRLCLRPSKRPHPHPSLLSLPLSLPLPQ